MVDKRFEEIMEFFGGKVDIAEDSEGINFDEPVKGKYVCRVVELIRNQGEWPSGDKRDQWELKLQACEDIEGDKSGNRFFTIKYDLAGGSTDFPKDAMKERDRLFNALATAGLKFENDGKLTEALLRAVAEKDLDEQARVKDEVLANIACQITDQPVNVSAYPFETKAGKTVQAKRIVNKFKIKAKKATKEEGKSGW